MTRIVLETLRYNPDGSHFTALQFLKAEDIQSSGPEVGKLLDESAAYVLEYRVRWLDILE